MAIAASSEARIAPLAVNYRRTSDALGDAAMRITTGYRILRNGDEPGTISVATGLQTQSSGLRSTLTSGARATSFLQVAADGLAQLRDVLTTLADLANTATAPGQTQLRYATLDGQFQSSLSQIDQIVAATRFNGTSILDGSASGSNAPVVYLSAHSSDSIALTIPDVSTSALFASTPSLQGAAAATAAVTATESAGAIIATAIATLDAYQQRLDTLDSITRRTLVGVATGLDDLLATDSTTETRTRERITLQQQTAAALLAQTLGLRSDLLGLLGG